MCVCVVLSRHVHDTYHVIALCVSVFVEIDLFDFSIDSDPSAERYLAVDPCNSADSSNRNNRSICIVRSYHAPMGRVELFKPDIFANAFSFLVFLSRFKERENNNNDK